jgi:hypothetical protein
MGPVVREMPARRRIVFTMALPSGACQDAVPTR